jgi:hypothetical protein
VEALAAAPHLSGLEVLDLSGNAIGDAGLRALAESPHLRGLRSLDVSNNRIGAEGYAALARARLPALHRLKADDISPEHRQALVDAYGEHLIA